VCIGGVEAVVLNYDGQYVRTTGKPILTVIGRRTATPVVCYDVGRGISVVLEQ
jgi:hypothetical protein